MLADGVFGLINTGSLCWRTYRGVSWICLSDKAIKLNFLVYVTELIRMVCWAGRMYLFSSINSAMSSGLRNDLMF